MITEITNETVVTVGAAHDRPGPLFLADWVDVVFVHYAVEPAALRPLVPFDLDLFRGRAYVSLVAFTQRRLRPAVRYRPAARLAAALSRPVACHEFLNVRTYVRHRGEGGIYFLAEWVPTRLAALIGPPLYGLPYRVGRLRYRHAPAAGRLCGRVDAGGAWLCFDGTLSSPGGCVQLGAAESGSLDEFLLERYTAFTSRGGVCRRFRIAHAPCPQTAAAVTVREAGLLCHAGGWCARAVPAGANYSPGVRDVGIGPPERVAPERRLLERA